MADTAEPKMQAGKWTANRRRSIAMGLIGLTLIVLIFWQVIPQIGDYQAAVQAMRQMTIGAMAVIALSVVIYLSIYGFVYRAAESRLSYLESQQVNQAAFTISNGVPAGGAVGLGVQFGMLTSFGIPATSATAAITAVSVWSTFVSLGFPVLGVIALTLAGHGQDIWWIGPLGLTILVLAITIFVGVMRSESLASRVGRVANAAVRPLVSRIERWSPPDFQAPIVKFRRDMYQLMRRRWLLLTIAQTGISFAQFLVLFMALRGVEGWSESGTSLLDAFGSFAISQMMLMVPVTPGGLGTVDALMIQLLVNTGTQPGNATAADLVWRASSYVPQVLLGIIAIAVWSRRAGRAPVRVGVAAKVEKGQGV